VVDLNGGGAGIDTTAAFTEDQASATTLAGSTTVSDVDSANMVSATATLTNHPDGSAEALSVTAASCGSITIGSYNSSTGVLALTGSASKATYASCLQTLAYNNSSQDPSSTSRSIEVKVNDGSLDSVVATVTLSVTAVNDPPVVDLNGAGSGTGYTNTFTEDGGAVAAADST